MTQKLLSEKIRRIIPSQYQNVLTVVLANNRLLFLRYPQGYVLGMGGVMIIKNIAQATLT